MFVESKNEIPNFKHDYCEIWKNLPKDVASELLQLAQNRMAGAIDLSSNERLETVLRALQKTMGKARYSYEVNKDRTEADVGLVGEEWAKSGFESETADFAYYPSERTALMCAMVKWLEDRMKRDLGFVHGLG